MADDNPYDDTEADYNPPETAYTGLRPTGQVAPEPQPAYAGQNPNDRVDARPANYTGDQSTDTTQFSTAAIPSGGEADPLGEGEIFQAPPAAPAGRSVQAPAPVRSVTNAQGQQQPLDAEGETQLNPVPGNAKYLTSHDGTKVFHAEPDANGRHIRAEDSLATHSDGKGRLVSRIAGLPPIDQGPDQAYLDKQDIAAEKKRVAYEAKAAADQVKALNVNLNAEQAYGVAAIGDAKRVDAQVDERVKGDVTNAETAHAAAKTYLDSTKAAYDALVKAKADIPPLGGKTYAEQIKDDDAARAYAAKISSIRPTLMGAIPANAAARPALPRIPVRTYRRRAPRRKVVTSFARSSFVSWAEAYCGGATAMKHRTERFDRRGAIVRQMSEQWPTGSSSLRSIYYCRWQAWCMASVR